MYLETGSSSATYDVFVDCLSNSVFGVSRFSEEEKENIRIYQQKVHALMNISNIRVNYDFFYRRFLASPVQAQAFDQ